MLQMVGQSAALVSTVSPAHLARTLLEQALDVLDADPPAARRILDRVNFFLDQRQAPVSETVDLKPLTPAGPPKGGLAPWQLRLVRDFIDENIAEPISIENLAVITRISNSHFCRAFKTSMGETAHRYIMRRRVSHAQSLMLDSRERLCQIAVACGLADQAHMTRVFRRFIGQTPDTWRRAFRTA